MPEPWPRHGVAVSTDHEETTMRAAAVIACLCLAVAGCSRSATADLKHAGDEVKQAGQDTGEALKASADEAKIKVDQAGEKAKKAADDVKHDVNGNNS